MHFITRLEGNHSNLVSKWDFHSKHNFLRGSAKLAKVAQKQRKEVDKINNNFGQLIVMKMKNKPFCRYWNRKSSHTDWNSPVRFLRGLNFRVLLYSMAGRITVLTLRGNSLKNFTRYISTAKRNEANECFTSYSSRIECRKTSGKLETTTDLYTTWKNYMCIGRKRHRYERVHI